MGAVDRKELILQAAEKSFSLFGYKATTMDRVAKGANVGKGTIYTFFADKEELFRAIMEQFIGKMKEAAEAVLDRERPLLDNMHRVLLAMLEFRKTHELTVQLSHEIRVLGTPMAKEALDAVEKAISAYIGEQLERAMAKGDIRPCDPVLTAFVLRKLYVSLALEWEQKSGTPLNDEEIWELIRLYMLDGLAAS